MVRGSQCRPVSAEAGILADHDPAEVARQVRAHSWYGGFWLPEETLKGILAFTKQNPCNARVDGRTVSFLPNEHGAMEKRLGQPIVLADYHAIDCKEIQDLLEDPSIAEIACRYFGYPPRRIFTRLHWAFVCDANAEQRRRAKQTLDFHYDLHASRFIYFNFYLTDVDDSAGPHVLASGSHGRKPLRCLFASANQSDDFIADTYGAANITSICGPAGYGFVEDHFCYHKATIPTNKNRLMMMVHVS